jgi:hypothetical protein
MDGACLPGCPRPFRFSKSHSVRKTTITTLKILFAVGTAAVFIKGAAVSVADTADTPIVAHFDAPSTGLKAADLIDRLKNPGPFEAFTPTDEVFAGLPAGTPTTCTSPTTGRNSRTS